MPEINILDKDTFSRIAAGEVVEKPASVVKELMENSLDAGATEITVETENGGLDLIKITDNGKGIRSDDLRRAFMPHATSKIKNTDDIFNITTLGFRGEALASVSSVSKVLLKSINRDENEGMEIYIEGGEEKYLKYSPVDRGTQIEVRNLFYNVPARMKFLKTPQREGTVIGDTILRQALANPGTAITYISNGKEMLKTFGSGNAEDVIRRVYNRKTQENVRFFQNEYDGYTIYGYIGNEELSRGSRNQQSIFINGRHITSRSLTAAVEQAFRSFITVSKFPFFILYLDIDPKSVDVNVHPQKAEVKFSDDRLMFKSVFDTVHKSLRDIYRNNLAFEDSFLKGEENEVSQSYFSEEGIKDSLTGKIAEDVRQGIFKKGNGDENNFSYLTDRSKGIPYHSSHKSEDRGIAGNISYPETSFTLQDQNMEEQDPHLSEKDPETTGYLHAGKTEAQIPIDLSSPSKDRVTDSTDYSGKVPQRENCEPPGNIRYGSGERYEGGFPDNETETSPLRKEAKFPGPRIIGQFMKTYILAESQSVLYLIDQHAAHEKVNFERYMKEIAGDSIIVQPLLAPDVLELSLDDYTVFKENEEIIKNAGFTLEDFGGRTVKVTEVPYFLGKVQSGEYIGEILDNLRNLGKGTDREVKYIKIATAACKASVRANDFLGMNEMTFLIEELRHLDEPFTCPHGRPTMIRITLGELEKMFRRI